MPTAATTTTEPCPCCAFSLPEGLFLPPPTRAAVGSVAADGALAPGAALTRLAAAGLTLVDTHGHAHLDPADDGPGGAAAGAEDDDPDPSPYAGGGAASDIQRRGRLVSVTCAVAPADWAACLAYAAESPARRAALGVHPWYVDRVLVGDEWDGAWLVELEALIQQHTQCFVGEIGLCRHAKFLRTFPGGKAKALELQQTVFVQQLELAARYRRPVSVHCVGQVPALLNLLTRLTADQRDGRNLPPVMALHSFSGSAHHVQQLLQWEGSLTRDESIRKGPLLYFGFSHSINYCGSASSAKALRQNAQAIRRVPRDRLLAESDVHRHRHVAAGTAGAVAYLTWALQQQPEESDSAEPGDVDGPGDASMSLEDVALLTTRNAAAFLGAIW